MSKRRKHDDNDGKQRGGRDTVISREEFEAMLGRMVGDVRTWCLEEGHTPHPRLTEAVLLQLVALLRGTMVDSAGGDGMGEYLESMDSILGAQPPDQRADLEAAVAQVRQFMLSVAPANDLDVPLGGLGHL